MINSKNTLHHLGIVTVAALALGASLDVNATVVGTKAVTPEPAISAKNDHVKQTASDEVSKRRAALDKKAIGARDNVLQAILLLDQKNGKQALSLLNKADAGLKAVLARDPALKLAPIDVRVSSYDIDSSPEVINKAIKDAKSALDNGKIQTARAILAPMTSEMHIYTDMLPMEIYPKAIKLAGKEIQDNKLNEAQATLADAMSSVVTEEEIIPLPSLKAEGDVLEAEHLLKIDKVKNKDKVLSLLGDADRDLSNANLLGYGTYQNIRDEIATTKSKVANNTSSPDLLERLKNQLHTLIHKATS